jgi:3-deoxy-manno-octulosonate cytidylyltransferase (CMP-KDO synthetase)
MTTAILVPARYASTRFPGKPLTMLGDKTMIARVVEGCKQTGLDTYVLTDNKTIAQAAKSAGAGVYIDSKDYANGTERCAGAVSSNKFNKYTHFINVQGDMPDVTVDMVQTVNRLLTEHHESLVTLFTDMEPELQTDPNTVKLVSDYGGKALWFGRGITGYGLHHLGIYGYNRPLLQLYPDLTIGSGEQVENLEQLRWLHNRMHLQLAKVSFDGIEINTPEDAEEWNARSR